MVLLHFLFSLWGPPTGPPVGVPVGGEQRRPVDLGSQASSPQTGRLAEYYYYSVAGLGLGSLLARLSA